MYKEQNRKKSKILRRNRILDRYIEHQQEKLFLKLIGITNTHNYYCKTNSLDYFTYIEFKVDLT